MSDVFFFRSFLCWEGKEVVHIAFGWLQLESKARILFGISVLRNHRTCPGPSSCVTSSE